MFTLVITHDYGQNVSKHKSLENAMKRLDTYVKDWWTRECGNLPMPTDRDERIAAYFEQTPAEGWDVY